MKAALYNGLVVAQRDGDWDHMDWDNGWWIVMMIAMLLLLALAVGTIWSMRGLAGGSDVRGGAPGGQAADPMAILDRRLAEGAISVEEYEERRRVLTGASGSASGEAT